MGPTKDGVISPIFQDRLKGMGEWLSINGEAIYSSKPWLKQNDSLTPNVWYTTKKDVVYGIVLFWPQDNVLELADVVSIVKDNNVEISLLGLNVNLQV